MIVGVILAAGKGTRMNSTGVNKTSLLFNGKPIIQYGVDLYKETTDKTVVVVGAFAQSIQQVLSGQEVTFVEQHDQLGTGHAVVAAVNAIEQKGWRPQSVLVGYGDHMMFYLPETARKLIRNQQEQHTALSLVTADYERTDEMRFGRIVRDEKGFVKAIVEHKDATEEERKITEFNPGFYCFDYGFLKNNIAKIEISPVSGEYYVTDMIALAVKAGQKVAALQVPFSEIGLGINTAAELTESREMYKTTRRDG